MWVRKPSPQTSPFLVAGASAMIPTTAANLRDSFSTTIARAALAEPGVVFANIPESQAEVRNDMRFRDMASNGHTVVLLGRELERHVSDDGSEPHQVPLRPDDPLWVEWSVIVCGPTLRTAFIAQAVDETAATTVDGLFRWQRVSDPGLVEESARTVMERCPHLELRLPQYRPPALT